MPTKAPPLKPNQRIAVNRIACGETQRQVAEELGVSEQTITAWVKLPAFHAAVNQEQEAMLECTRDRMRALGIKVVETLSDVLENAQRSADRLKAAEIVLHHIGFTDLQSGLWGWGIEQPASSQQQVMNKQFDNLLSELLSK